MFPLRIVNRLDPSDREQIARALRNLPQFAGKTISVQFLPQLTAYRGKLLSGKHNPGTPVYAAAFIRERRIVLETRLLRNPGKLRLILIHELFHFIWVVLGNRKRNEYAELLRKEWQAHARAELGESSSVRKERLRPADCVNNSKGWREYVCESFCDSAAWCYSGSRSSEFVIARRWRLRRREWMLATFLKNSA